MELHIDSINISGETLEEALLSFKQRLENILSSNVNKSETLEKWKQDYKLYDKNSDSNFQKNSITHQEVINNLVRAFTVNINNKMSLYRAVEGNRGIDEMHQIPGGVEVFFTGIKKSGFLKINIDKYLQNSTFIDFNSGTSLNVFPYLSNQVNTNEFYGAASFIEIIPVNNNLDKHTKEFYYVKEGDGLEKIINRFYTDFDYSTGNDRRTIAKAIHILNERSNHKHGIYFRNPSTDFLDELEGFLKATIDPYLKEQRIFYSSILLSKNKILRLPTNNYVKTLKEENVIESRPEFLDLAIAGARSYQGFIEGFYSGIYNEIKDIVVGLWDLIKGIFTGQLFKNIWDLIKTIVKGEGYEKILKPMLDSIGQSWDDFWKKFNSGNPRLRWFLIGEIVGKIILNILLAFLTMGATVALAASTRGAALMAKYGKFAKIVETAIDNIPKPARKKIEDVLGDKAGDVLKDSDNRNLAKQALEKAKKEAKKEALEKANRLDKKKDTDPEQFGEFLDDADNVYGKEPPLESVNQRKDRLHQKKKAIEEKKIKQKIENIKKQTLQERKKELGTDPKRGYIEHEAEVGSAIEKQFGHFARSTKADEEWISLSGPYKGKTFDLIGLYKGDAVKILDEHFKIDFIQSLKIHILGNDIVILDYRYMTPFQKQTVLDFTKTLSSSEFKQIRSIFTDNDLKNIK